MARSGVRVEPLSRYAAGAVPSVGFALGYGGIDAERIRPGPRLLARAIRGRT